MGNGVILSDTEPVVDNRIEPRFAWLNPTTGVWSEAEKVDGKWTWVEVATIPIAMGLTKSIKLADGVLHIKNGLVQKWTPT